MYRGTLNVNKTQALELLSLADKYIQEDLRDKCANALVHNLTSENVSEMLDLAREQDLFLLKDWCAKFLQNRMDLNNLPQFIQGLNALNPEYETENRQVIETAVDYALGQMSAILRLDDEEVVNLIEDFLETNISIENIVKLTLIFENFEKKMANLRETVLDFVCTYKEVLKGKGLAGKLPWNFHHHKPKRNEQKPKEDGKMSIESKAESTSKESPRKALKRMDPSNHSIEEEEEETGPILKKTK